MILIRAVGSMHPSVLLELNKFVIGSLNTILQRLPLVQSPTMSMLLNTDRARDWPLNLRPTGTDWLVLILGLNQQHTALSPGFPQALPSPRTPHSYFIYLSSKCIKKREDFYVAHQRGIFRAWNRVCVAYLPVWPEGRRAKHTISAGSAL